MYIIGITGGSGTGKSTALRVLDRIGALVIDCDAIYHELLSENESLKSELASRFEGVLQDGSIDRKRLGEIVFDDPQALTDLSAITHKYVRDEVERRLAHWERYGGLVAAIEAIALIESGRSRTCDVVVAVVASEEKRLQRITERDGITREQAKKRIQAQKPDSFYKENCNYVLVNNYDTANEFAQECVSFFGDLTGEGLYEGTRG